MIDCRITTMATRPIKKVNYIGSVQWHTQDEGVKWFDLYLSEDRESFCYRYDSTWTGAISDFGLPLKDIEEDLVPEFCFLVQPFVERALIPDLSVSPNAR